MKFNSLALIVSVIIGSLYSTQANEGIPDRYATVADDSLMRLLINKGFAKEKEDNLD